MATWKEVVETWTPIVEKMEEHHMDDYAIPEIFRAAEEKIEELRTNILDVLEKHRHEEEPCP